MTKGLSWWLAVSLALVVAAGTRGQSPVSNAVIASGVTAPTDIRHAGDGSGRLFLVQQEGLIRILSGTNLLATPFLDLRGQVLNSGEQGLLGLAFHPNYRVNGRFFVYYTQPDGQTNLLVRFTASPPDSAVADPASKLVVLAIPHPNFDNHNGGALAFGPDGYLYVGVGDGGSACDPSNQAQDLGVLPGKLLRLDVDGAEPYAVPATNPFVNTPGARGEIWAYGLRNPWRISFDRATGDLVIADVGQGLREEIDFQSAGSTGGANYGWRFYEGTATNTCAVTGSDFPFVVPILEYGHDLGRCAVTGGYRYRGALLPLLAGRYVYADYCTGELFAAAPATNGVWTSTLLQDEAFQITTFGEDENGELYVGDATNGRILKLLPGVTWWSGATALGDGWMSLDWFGVFYPLLDNWLYHQDHGWLYSSSVSATNVVFWDNSQQRFWWTSSAPGFYPNLYRFDGAASTWLWYFVGTVNPRWFYNYTTAQFESQP